MARTAGTTARELQPGEITPRIGVVCFAMGFAQASGPGPVPGPVLLRLLADLGVSDGAARSLLLRMRREGLLSSQRAGRQAGYLLAPSVSAAQARTYRQLNGERPAWTGAFSGLLFTVPERHRAFRGPAAAPGPPARLRAAPARPADRGDRPLRGASGPAAGQPARRPGAPGQPGLLRG